MTAEELEKIRRAIARNRSVFVSGIPAEELWENNLFGYCFPEGVLFADPCDWYRYPDVFISREGDQKPDGFDNHAWEIHILGGMIYDGVGAEHLCVH